MSQSTASAAAEYNLSHAAELEGMVDAPHGVTNTTTEAHGEGAAHVNPTALGLDATWYVAAAMVAVIAILLWKKVPVAIGGALDRKIAGIRTQLDEATRLRTEAEALRNEYLARSAAAEGEAASIRAHAEQEAATLIENARTEAEALVARRGRMAEDKIAAAEAAAVASIRDRVASVAAGAAAQVIAARHDAEADRRVVDGVISRLG